MNQENINKARLIIQEADWDYMPLEMATCISKGYIEALNYIEELWNEIVFLES